MDPVKRQAYDSTLPFDDSLPPPDLERTCMRVCGVKMFVYVACAPAAGADFFRVYQPVFFRNARCGRDAFVDVVCDVMWRRALCADGRRSSQCRI
jgi:hypothetical protein